MFIHEDNAGAWNAVDVRVDEDQLQHGHVINIVEDGLIIDFGCTAQRSVCVKYGRILDAYSGRRYTFTNVAYYEADSETPWCDPADGEDALVLLRSTPHAAWLWYPGKAVFLSGFCCDDAVLVQVPLPHGDIVTELLPEEQVRDADQTGRREIVEKDFVIRCCPLPAGYWPEASASLTEKFKFHLHSQHEVLCTAILSQTLLYLQRQTAAPLEAATVEQSYATAKVVVSNNATIQLFPTSRVMANSAEKQRKTPASKGLTRSLASLPMILQTEILQTLDTMERVRCRRVSSLWNTLLTSDAYFPDVCMSGRKAGYIQYGRYPMHWLVACMIKCLGIRTRTVVIRHLQLFECQSTALLITKLRHAVRLPTLVFDRCQFNRDEDGENHREYMGEIIKNTVGAFAAADRVVCNNCRLDDGNLQADVALKAFSAQPEALLETQLWDLLEENLVLKKPLDVQWVTECIANQSREQIEKKIIGVLDIYQSVDPRVSTHYRSRQWTVDDALKELDVGKLNRVATVALSEGVVIDPDE
ncbi:uncharacterized protein LOC129596635 [Paramacrobiotus metropolitanus]|uniref:uncharacterized protein LOC129596635 n=1 Tax=Paramacrobiotus metropolitanus TaxID=2943436 RepID=UPI0024457D80|nr:uncharacterized protein LOC129596635 [Paramacrobiotus metropolitanus]